MLIFLWSFIFIKTILSIILICSEFRKLYIDEKLIEFLESEKEVFIWGEALSHHIDQTIMKDISTPAIVFPNIF